MNIKFNAPFGDEIKSVRLFNPTGSGDGFHVYVNDYYEGIIVKIAGTWVGHLNVNSTLTFEDVQTLGERIDNS